MDRMFSKNVSSTELQGNNIPKYTNQLNYENERLKSFQGWPVTFLDPKVMAQAGFYYLKREDVVRCVFCGVEVGQWAAGDVPMEDHMTWSPLCKFVRKLSVGNVPIHNTSEETQEMYVGNGYDTCGRIELRPECAEKDRPLPTLEKLGIYDSRAPAFTNYTTLDARLRSYELWPIAMKLKPNTLSEAGFFYTGKGDQTMCFHCGGCLGGWEESDDPWEEHAQWFSKCNFVLLVKGKDYVDQVCGRKVKKVKSKSEDCTNNEEQKTSQMPDNSSKCEYTNYCKICYTDELAVVFLPCGHLVACVKCALSLKTCAVCRRAVTATVRVYLS